MASVRSHSECLSSWASSLDGQCAGMLSVMPVQQNCSVNGQGMPLAEQQHTHSLSGPLDPRALEPTSDKRVKAAAAEWHCFELLLTTMSNTGCPCLEDSTSTSSRAILSLCCTYSCSDTVPQLVSEKLVTKRQLLSCAQVSGGPA